MLMHLDCLEELNLTWASWNREDLTLSLWALVTQYHFPRDAFFKLILIFFL